MATRDDRAITVSYEEIGQMIGRLVDKKNAAYGDSFHRSGEIVRILYPRGVRPGQVDDMLAIIRIIDKMFRIATNRDALGENPRADIAGYAILMCRDLLIGQVEPHDDPGGDQK